MKEAIRMVLESIYDPKFTDTSHSRSGRGCHSVLRRIKEEWGTSCWFLEFNIRKSFHTIDRYRLISIFKEEIDDPKFFYSIQKVFSAGRLVGGEKALTPSHTRIGSILLRTGRIGDQENSGEEVSFNAPQEKRVIIVGRVKSIQRKAAFHSLVSSWHTPPPKHPLAQGGPEKAFRFPPFIGPCRLLNKPSSLLCAAFLIEAAGLTPKAEFYAKERCNNNWAMRDSFKSCKRKGLLIELGGEAILVIRSERGLAHKLAPLKTHYNIRICYARYADDLLLRNRGSTTIVAWSTTEFLGTVIREVPPRTTPIQFLRELEKRLRVKHRIHITACHLRSAIHSKFRNLGNSIPIKQLTKGMSGIGSLLDAVQLAETLGTAGVRSPQVRVLWGTVKHIRQGSRGISLLHSSGRSKVPLDVQQAVSRSGTHARKLSLYTPPGQKAAGEGGGHWDRSISSEFPIQMEAPIKKILRRLRDRVLISRRRPCPIHVACLTNVSDGDIINWSAGIAVSPLSYYRCRDNLYQVRTIVDHQIRWSAIFTPAHKHKSSAQNIIPKYSKDSNRVNEEGGKTFAELPNSIELGKLRSGQNPSNKEHATTSLL
ncbi:Group II intron-encoded protein LtrA [Sesamum alatum]|uniref:Group II intron-encoded protein LtrA n=1 Tax=Sesamum alatum TaxID=300844 RepID=A0AAE2CFG5_9LAMI|nr:Group II intron-encoded protein LtrA [Sesamum alatum]